MISSWPEYKEQWNNPAAEEMAVASGIHYLMYAGSTLMKSNVLEPTLVVQQASIDI